MKRKISLVLLFYSVSTMTMHLNLFPNAKRVLFANADQAVFGFALTKNLYATRFENPNTDHIPNQKEEKTIPKPPAASFANEQNSPDELSLNVPSANSEDEKTINNLFSPSPKKEKPVSLFKQTIDDVDDLFSKLPKTPRKKRKNRETPLNSPEHSHNSEQPDQDLTLITAFNAFTKIQEPTTPRKKTKKSPEKK